MRRSEITSILAMELALFTIFASSNFFLFAWESPIGYYLLIILASFFGGALIVDFARSLKQVSIAYIAGCIGFLFFYILPPILYGESYPGQIDATVAVVATQLSRIVIVSFPVSVFTCLFGCFSTRA